ncbi:hypothetical protein GCM10009809_06670 [Isoptericola hypogeus]|uniref:T6SS Phospholipase effector Tle1-like catalytic domain-containing protein n=1 Tax=Isoptericola hypogeus TaxID=300179 RepID=A0ABN2IWK5_9MICO
MKRIVLCCDGTWNHAVNPQVSNIVKLARSIPIGSRRNRQGEDVVQLVFYVGGVGAHGYLVDQLLGGAFGYGITRNVIDGYRSLAMAYEPGDQIVVVGYSRGAYTARSVVGMISQVGLLEPEAADAGLLSEAERVYRMHPPSPRRLARAERVARRARPGSWRRRRAELVLARVADVAQAKARFRAEHGRVVDVDFLGVFDTVGALGVPGPSRRKNRFHDVSLSPIVRRARQALAIDERRITFAPCLWTVPDDDPAGRVEQVWFPGTHGDVGGGGVRCGLSDLALQWMADELRDAGVVLDERRLTKQLTPRASLVLAQDPPWAFRVLNVAKRLVPGYGVVDGRLVFRRGLRVLALPSAAGTWRDGVRLADTVLRYVLRDAYGALAPNLAWWMAEAGGVERVPVEPIPAARADLRPLVVPGDRVIEPARDRRALPTGR